MLRRNSRSVSKSGSASKEDDRETHLELRSWIKK